MSCTYSNGNYSIEGSSIEEVRRRLLIENDLAFGANSDLRGLLLQDLNFFHDTSEINIPAVLNKMKLETDSKTTPRYEAVTTISANVAGYNEQNLTKRLQWAKEISTTVGTYIHNYIMYKLLLGLGKMTVDEFQAKKDEFIQFMEKQERDLKTNPEVMNLFNDANNPNINSYLRTLKDFVSEFFLNDNEDKFFDSLEQTANNLYSEGGILNNVFSIFETEIYTTIPDSTERIGGRIDCITYDKDTKEITIYDFKTSAITKATNRSNAVLQDHYMQLQLYRNILAKELHIPLSSIKIKNIYFSYTSQGVELKEEVDTETSLGAGNLAASIKMAIKLYFPTEANPITDEESKLLVAETEKTYKTIISDSMSIRNTEESIKDHIDKAYKNLQEIWLSLSADNLAITKITMEGEIYHLYDKNGTEVASGTLDELAQKEVSAIREKESSTYEDMISAIRSKDIAYLKNSLSRRPKLNRQLYLALSRYFSSDWEYVSNPTLENFGVVQIYNESKNQTDFIVLITDIANTLYIRNPNDNIISLVYKNKELLKEFKEFDELPEGSIQNIYKLKALIAIAKFAKTLPEDITVGCVRTVSTLSGVHDLGLNTPSLLKALLLIEYGANNHNDQMESPELYKDIHTTLSKLKWKTKEEIIATNTVSALRAAKEDTSLGLDEFINEDTLNLKIEALAKLLDEIEEQYPDVTSKTKHFDTEIGALYGEISYYLNSLLNLTPETMYEMHKRSLTFLESLVAGFNLLTKADTNKFTKRGLRLAALAQGLETSISYANPDLLIRRTNALCTVYSAQIASSLQKDINEINIAVKDWLTELHIPLDNKVTGGRHDDYYSRFLKKDSNGKINKDMIFLNPYESQNSGLFTSEKEKYALEVILWGINRSRIKDLDDEALKLSYAELKQNETWFLRYKEKLTDDSTYLKVPLRKKQGSSKIITGVKSFFSGKKPLKSIVESWVDSWRLFVEPVILSEDQSTARDLAYEENKYYNYFVENEKNRSTRTENTDPEEWEINFNRIAGEFIAEHYKEVYFNKFLKVVDKQLATIKFMEIVTGKNFENQFDALKNRIKISVYNKSLVDNEDEDLVKALGGMKYLASLTKIAVRPALFVKEMLLGRIKNTSAILTNQVKNDEDHPILMKHMIDAAKVVFGSNFFLEQDQKYPTALGDKGPGDFGFVDAINNVYLINDRDLNAIGDTLTYDNYGIGNWGSRMLYLNTVKPDWFNRMIIFIAKMKADGTYNAHSRDEKTGLLKYDATKDERFSYFFEHCSNDGVQATDKKKYLELKSLYKLRMDQFIKEGWTNEDGTSLETGTKNEDGTYRFDKLPRAYTQKENDSIKEQIGLIYGYYTHEERANMQKGLWWTLHTQFLTFLPGEIRRYFANGKNASSINKVVHVESLEKDPETGERLKLYYKPDKKTGLTKKVTTKNNTGIDQETGEYLEPVYESVDCPLEGLATSTIKTVGRLCRGDFKDLKNDPEAWDKTKLFMFNMLFAAVIAAIIGLLNSNGVTANKSSALVGSSMDTLTRTANELNFFLSVLAPVRDFGLVGVEYTQEVLASAAKAIERDGYSIADFANDNFSLIKDTHVLNA